MELRDRLLKVIDDRFGTQKNFAEQVGVSRQSIHSVLKNGSPSLDFLNRLHEQVPDLNLNWLLFEMGDVYLSRDELLYNIVKKKTAGYESGKLEMITLLKETVERLNLQVETLQTALIEKVGNEVQEGQSRQNRHDVNNDESGSYSDVDTPAAPTKLLKRLQNRHLDVKSRQFSREVGKSRQLLSGH